MIFLLLATIFFASVSVALYYKYKDLKLELEVANGNSATRIQEIINLSTERDKLKSKIKELRDLLNDEKCKTSNLEDDNLELAEAVEKLSQKELIQECRMFWNHLHQTRNRINSAVESIEKEFVKVKRIYEAQTTVDECVTSIKSTPVKLSTVQASGIGVRSAEQIDKWPYESRFWNGSEE